MAYSGLDVGLDVFLGSWTDAKKYIRNKSSVSLTRGRQNLKSTMSPSQATMLLDNRDGRWTIRNPVGAWYGTLVQNSPVRVSVPSSLAGIPCYLRMETDNSSFASAPDAAGLQITSGTLSVRIDCKITDWRTANLFGKWGATGKSWLLALSGPAPLSGGSGSLVLFTFDGSSQWSANSALPVPYYNGRIAIRADYNITGQTVTFFTAPTMSGSWTQLGPVVTIGATALSGAVGQAVQVGTVNTSGFNGEVYEAQVLATGVLEADPVFTSQTPGATTFTDGQSNTWTLNGTAELSGRLFRFHGELAALAKAAAPNSADAYAQAQAGGITRRMSQQQSPADSAMRRAYVRSPASIHLGAYWTGEDAAGASQIGPAVGVHAMTNAGLTMASSSAFACSAPLPVMNGATASGIVDPNSVTWTDNVVRWLMQIPAGGETDGATLMTVSSSGGTVGTIILTYSLSTGFLTATCFSPAGANLGSIAHGLNYNGRLCRIGLALQTSGSNLTLRIESYTINDTVVHFATGTLASATIGAVTGITAGSAGITQTVMGHWSVQGVYDNAIFGTAGTTAVNAWLGETAANRIERLCAEEGIACRIIGPPDLTQKMGTQTRQTILALLQECEATDQGLLTEPRQVLGLGYITQKALCQQPVAATADYSKAQLDTTFSAISDDTLIVNDATMTAADGSTTRQILAAGSMSVQSPPSGAGRFDTAVTVNPQYDSALSLLDGWYEHVRTADEDRYAALPFQLARAGQPQSIPLLDIGSYLQVINPPPWVPPGPVKQLVVGYSETLGPQPVWQVTFNGIPEVPYETAILNDPVFGHLDTAGSQLNTGVNTSATSWSVATTAGPLWTTNGGDFPFDWKIAGEVVTVTLITGASSPQTATVTRSVNGVVKSHLAGEAISLAHPMILAL